MRLTKNRKIVYNFLLNSKEPLTAYQLFEQLPSMSLTTIYRSLDYLVSKKYLKYFVLNDSKYYYVSLQHKHFFQCTNCKRLFTFSECLMDPYEKYLEKIYDFKVHEHFVFFSGLCNECSNDAIRNQ